MTESHSQSTNSSWAKYLPLLVSGLLIAGGVVAYQTSSTFQQFVQEAWSVLTSNDRPRITHWVAQFGWWGPLLIVGAMIAQIFLVVIPSWGLMVVAVLAYGPVWGVLLSLGATATAASVAYVVGMYVGDVVVRQLVGDKTVQRVERWVKQNGFGAVALMRVSPFISGDAISLVSGLAKMQFLKFISATLLGVIPLTVAIGYFGSNTSRLKQGFLWLTVASGIMLIGYWVYGRFLKKKNTTSASSEVHQ